MYSSRGVVKFHFNKNKQTNKKQTVKGAVRGSTECTDILFKAAAGINLIGYFKIHQD